MILLESWKQALGLLSPKPLLGIIKQLKNRLAKTIIEIVCLLKWVVIADCIIFFIFGREFTLALEHIAARAQAQAIPFSVTLLSIVVSISLFLLQGSFLIFVRKTQASQGYTSRDYFRTYFIRYVQLALFFSLIFVVLLSFVMNLGVTKIPGVHWGYVFFLRIIELLILFYWLDSGFSFKDLLYSCERGLNFFFYNLPVFVVVFAVMMAVWLLVDFSMPMISLDDVLPTNLVKNHLAYKIVTSVITVLVRYGKMAIEFIGITFLFVIYQRRKQASYNKSLFEE